MIQSFKRSLVVTCLVALFAAPAAFAGGMSLSLVGAGVLPQGIDSTVMGISVSMKGKFGFGGGALIERHFSPMIGLESGMVYLSRKYTGEALGVSADFSSNSLYVPLGVRVHFNRYLSLQGGGFYDLSVESGGGSNLGLQGGLGISIPLGQKADFFVDGRYNLGLKDISGEKQSDVLLALAGFTFHFGSGK